MVTADQARFGVGVVGNVISLFLFLSPVPTFWRICKKKSVEEFSPIPYLSTLLNCMLWVFYGLPIVKPGAFLVLSINGTGLVIEAVYIAIFLIYSPRRLRLKVLKFLSAEIAFMVVVVLLVLLLGHTHDIRILIVGILCVIFGTCMYASPLSIMSLVIRTKSVEYMPFFLSLVGFLNGICWTTYALLRFDIFITIPNGLGALFGAAQLILYGCYYRTTPRRGDAKGEIQLPTVNPTVTSTVAPAAGDVTVTVDR